MALRESYMVDVLAVKHRLYPDPARAVLKRPRSKYGGKGHQREPPAAPDLRPSASDLLSDVLFTFIKSLALASQDVSAADESSLIRAHHIDAAVRRVVPKGVLRNKMLIALDAVGLQGITYDAHHVRPAAVDRQLRCTAELKSPHTLDACLCIAKAGEVLIEAVLEAAVLGARSFQHVQFVNCEHVRWAVADDPILQQVPGLTKLADGLLSVPLPDMPGGGEEPKAMAPRTHDTFALGLCLSSPLFDACERGDAARLEELLRIHKSDSSFDALMWSHRIDCRWLIHVALVHGHTACVQVLLEHDRFPRQELYIHDEEGTFFEPTILVKRTLTAVCAIIGAASKGRMTTSVALIAAEYAALLNPFENPDDLDDPFPLEPVELSRIDVLRFKFKFQKTFAALYPDQVDCDVDEELQLTDNMDSAAFAKARDTIESWCCVHAVRHRGHVYTLTADSEGMLSEFYRGVFVWRDDEEKPLANKSMFQDLYFHRNDFGLVTDEEIDYDASHYTGRIGKAFTEALLGVDNAQQLYCDNGFCGCFECDREQACHRLRMWYNICRWWVSKWSVSFDEASSSILNILPSPAALHVPSPHGVGQDAAIPPTQVQETRDFITAICDEKMLQSAFSQLPLESSRLSLGTIDEEVLQRARAILLQLKGVISKKDEQVTLQSLSQQLYACLPHASHHPCPTIDTPEALRSVQALVRTLEDLHIAHTIYKSSHAATEAGGSQHPTEVMYQQLRADLVLMSPSDADYSIINTYLRNTSTEVSAGDRKLQCKKQAAGHANLRAMWRVKRHDTEDGFDSFDSTGNRFLLWHGTNMASVSANIQRGLRIPPEGGWHGVGLHFSDSQARSAADCVPFGGLAVMFLVEVPLGHVTPVNFSRFGTTPSEYSNGPAISYAAYAPSTLETHNIECLRKELDAAQRHHGLSLVSIPPGMRNHTAELCFDGKAVAVPQGAVEPSQMGFLAQCLLREIAVFKESQHRLRYVLLLDW